MSLLQKFALLKEKANLITSLLILDILWSGLSIYADLNWLSQIPWYLILFTSICSLYPPLLVIWYLTFIIYKKVPGWYTALVFVGLFTYGIAAQIYFPLLMTWNGFNFHDFGSMFWVAVYGLQALVIKSQLKNITWPKLLPAVLFFIGVDFFHYTYPTFLDYTLYNYPLWLKYFSSGMVVFLQICALGLILFISKKNKNSIHPTSPHPSSGPAKK